MSSAHFIHDAYPAFVSVLLPILIPRFGLSLAEAGMLASGVRITTLLQPVLGYFADRTNTRYWVVIAPATTATMISLIGIAPSFFAIFVLLLLSGLSHAAFHPAAAAMVTRFSGNRWGAGMSWFMTGGELGRALGPLYITAILQFVDLTWSWIALIPGLLVSLILTRRIGPRSEPARRRPVGRMRTALGQARGPVLQLSFATAFRAVANGALVTFLPTWATLQGADLIYAGTAIVMYELGGTVGAMAGGTASDRLGRRAVLALSLAVGLPAIATAMLLLPGPLQLLALAIAGFAVLSGMPVQLVMMQELLPDNRSTATGIAYFMTNIGAILSMIAVGAAADLIGLQGALLVALVVASSALPVIWLLPRRLTLPQEHR